MLYDIVFYNIKHKTTHRFQNSIVKMFYVKRTIRLGLYTLYVSPSETICDIIYIFKF